MKVLHITVHDSNGAGIAASRIVEAQRNLGIDSKLLVREKEQKANHIIKSRKFKVIDYALNKVFRLIGLDFMVSLESLRIRGLKEFRKADIIHIHNIHHNRFFHPIFWPKNKKYVYTLHDMWGITGNCNYNYSLCNRFTDGCYSCPLNKDATKYGFSKLFLNNTKFHWNLKQNIYKNLDITFVTPSDWLSTLCRNSKISSNKPVLTISNCLIKTPENLNNSLVKSSVKVPKILFIGQKNRNNDRKGYSYLLNAINRLDIPHEIHLVGKFDKDISQDFDNKNTNIVVHGPLSYDRLSTLMKELDMLILPTLQDNLPNTILECFVHGMPVISFNTGGVPELVTKETGYLARLKNVDDIIKGIYHVTKNLPRLSANTLRISEGFSENVCSEKHYNLYKQILNN